MDATDIEAESKDSKTNQTDTNAFGYFDLEKQL